MPINEEDGKIIFAHGEMTKIVTVVMVTEKTRNIIEINPRATDLGGCEESDRDEKPDLQFKVKIENPMP